MVRVYGSFPPIPTCLLTSTYRNQETIELENQMKVLRPALFFFALFAMAVSSSTAEAQFGGQLGGSGSLINLLLNERVQNELSLNDEQKKEVTTLNEDLRSDLQDMLTEMRSPGRDRQLLRDDFRAGLKKLTDATELKMEKLLNEKQQVRAKELKYQRQILSGVARALAGALGKELGVEQADIDAVTARTEEVRKWEAEQIAKIRVEAREKILTALPEESRKKLKEKMGTTFDFGEQRRPRTGSGGARSRGGARSSQRPKSEF